MFATSSSIYRGRLYCAILCYGHLCQQTYQYGGVLTPWRSLMALQPSVSGLDNGKWSAVLFSAPHVKKTYFMFKQNESRARAENEQTELITFQFSESKNPVRNLLIDGEPWFVAKDVCDILGHSNPSSAIQMLDEDERAKKSLGRQGKGWVVNESGLYMLILRSNKPTAKTFRKWVTAEVLPELRKRGYYGTQKAQPDDFIDARNVSYEWTEINGFPVRTISVDGQIWLSINDVNKALRAATDGCRIAKKLNAKEILAIKIFVFGNTHPSWFTNEKGLSLILSGSRKNAAQFRYSQLSLPFGKGE